MRQFRLGVLLLPVNVVQAPPSSRWSGAPDHDNIGAVRAPADAGTLAQQAAAIAAQREAQRAVTVATPAATPSVHGIELQKLYSSAVTSASASR